MNTIQPSLNYTAPSRKTMQTVSIDQFRATLKVSHDTVGDEQEEVYTYWNNQLVSATYCNREEVLHIAKRLDGSFYLEIGNILHSGSLSLLEEKLFEWAMDEGWLDAHNNQQPSPLHND